METIKYIVKRLVLAVVILLGVSVIIYGMSRMMPTDYVDTQYSSALAQGTMTQADIDNIKELYGLNMPDAFLTITAGEGSEFAGMQFRTSAKEDTYESNIKYGSRSYFDWYTGVSSDTTDELLKANAKAAYENGDTRLVLYHNNRIEIGKVMSRDLIPPEEITDESTIEVSVVFIPEERGTFEIVETEDMDLGIIRQIKVVLDGTRKELDFNVEYRTATGGEKFVAVIDGYFTWLGNMFKGDLGMSFKHKRPVSEVILENMGISFAIAFLATILQFLIAIPLGIEAATHQYGAVDYTVTILTMIGISLPTFFFAAIVIRIFAVGLGWFEVGGITSASLPVNASWIMKLGDTLWHMVLPMVV
ncbi:MAG: ABC transporter permease, partial [Clostridia bacterium]|nr:ABC transporter permease [Clostridia bacterium]